MHVCITLNMNMNFMFVLNTSPDLIHLFVLGVSSWKRLTPLYIAASLIIIQWAFTKIFRFLTLFLLQFVLTLVFRISAKICFFTFLPHPTQDLLAANVRHSPFLAPKTPPPLTRSEFRKGWNKNWNVNILRNAFQSLETFFRNFMII